MMVDCSGTDTDSGGLSTTWVIVICAAGGAVVLGGVGIACYCCRKRRLRNIMVHSPTGMQMTMKTPAAAAFTVPTPLHPPVQQPYMMPMHPVRQQQQPLPVYIPQPYTG